MSYRRSCPLPLSPPLNAKARPRNIAAAEGHTSRKRILVIANPAAGSLSQRRLARMVAGLEAKGCSVMVYQTLGPGEAEHYIASHDLGEFNAIAAAGGDGTFNEVLNGLPEHGPPLAVLPFGTVNVLAKEIGQKASIEAIAETVAFGPCRRIAIGEANGRRFAIMASVGLDAMVVDHVNLALKRRIGRLAYLYEALKQLTTERTLTYRLRIDGREEEAQGIIIANGRCYAGHYVSSPGADLEKPMLDVCRLTRTGRLAPASYFCSLVLGRFAERADVRISETAALEILGPGGAPLQADGDILCRLPASIRILPAAVDLIFPPAAQASEA